MLQCELSPGWASSEAISLQCMTSFTLQHAASALKPTSSQAPKAYPRVPGLPRRERRPAWPRACQAAARLSALLPLPGPRHAGCSLHGDCKAAQRCPAAAGAKVCAVLQGPPLCSCFGRCCMLLPAACGNIWDTTQILTAGLLSMPSTTYPCAVALCWQHRVCT